MHILIFQNFWADVCMYNDTYKKTIEKLLLRSLMLGAGALFVCMQTRSIPAYADVVEDFDVEKYGGKWYEIARFILNMKGFETAEYTLLTMVDRVVNRVSTPKRRVARGAWKG